jgi:hypothetical protein
VRNWEKDAPFLPLKWVRGKYWNSPWMGKVVCLNLLRNCALTLDECTLVVEPCVTVVEE